MPYRSPTNPASTLPSVAGGQALRVRARRRLAWLRNAAAAGTLTLAMLQGSPRAEAQIAALPGGEEFRVHTSTERSQRGAAVAMDTDGDFVVVWEGYEGFGSPLRNYGIFGQRFSANGAALGDEFKLNTFTTNLQADPAVAADADGNFVVTWNSTDQDVVGRSIYARRYAADGTALGAEFRVSTSIDKNAANSAVAMDADGDFVVVWQSVQDGSGYGVYGQRFAADGTPEGGEFLVNTYTSGTQFESSVAMDADGDFVVAWQSYQDVESSGGYSDGIYAQRFASDGTPVGGEFQVNTYTTAKQITPSVGIDAVGGFVIAWASGFFSPPFQDGSFYGIYAQRHASDGTRIGSEFRVNTTTPSSQSNPSIGLDDDGDFVIAWKSGRQDDVDGFDGVFAQRYASDGTPEGGEFQVNTYTPKNQSEPAVAVDSDGDVVIAWNSIGQDDPLGREYTYSFSGIYAQRYALVQPTVEGGTFALPILGDEGWRMLAQPNGTTLAALLASVWTQGVPGGDVSFGDSNVLVYDEPVAGAEGVGFVPPSTLAGSAPGLGVIVYLFADDDPTDGENDVDGGFPKTLSAPYTAPAGTVAPAATYTDNGTLEADGWNLLGNPFAEPLSWDAVRANAGFQNVEATVYVWDQALNAYRTWNGSSGDLLGGLISGGQGFFVKATAASPAVPFAADDTGTIDGRTYSAYSRLGTPVKLALTLDTEAGQARAFVEAGFGGENGRDAKDGVLLSPLARSFAQLYTRPFSESAEAEPLVINSLALDALEASEAPMAIPLGVAVVAEGLPAGGAMTLRWPEILLPAGWRAELHDTQTGVVVDLAEANAYTFTLDVAAQPNGRQVDPPLVTPGTQALPQLLLQGGSNPVARVAASDRFELVLMPANVVATGGDEALPTVLTLGGNYPNPFTEQTTLRYALPEQADVRVAVYDVLGREVLVVQDGPQAAGWHTRAVDASLLAAGLYLWCVETQTASGRSVETGRMLVVK